MVKTRSTSQTRLTGLSFSAGQGFSLLELLIVIAIIGILVGMLLPGVQSIREAARRLQCAGQIQQQSLAMLNFESAHQHFPPGIDFPSNTMWSAFLLPFMDQENLHASLDLNGPWVASLGANQANINSLQARLPYMQCPSAGLPESEFDSFVNNVRTPSCYLACSSGLLDREAGDFPWAGMDAFGDWPASDGIFFVNSETKITQIQDGLSSTVLIGESLPDQLIVGIDASGNPQKVDHWLIGSFEIVDMASLADQAFTENSECLGSTAAPLNSLDRPDSTIDEKELCFGSAHPDGVNLGFADGHTQFVDEGIDPEVLAAIGGIASGEIVSEIP